MGILQGTAPVGLVVGRRILFNTSGKRSAAILDGYRNEAESAARSRLRSTGDPRSRASASRRTEPFRRRGGADLWGAPFARGFTRIRVLWLDRYGFLSLIGIATDVCDRHEFSDVCCQNETFCAAYVRLTGIVNRKNRIGSKRSWPRDGERGRPVSAFTLRFERLQAIARSAQTNLRADCGRHAHGATTNGETE